MGRSGGGEVTVDSGHGTVDRDPHQWIVVLRDECERHTQKWVADQIGYSAAVVNQVLKGSYKGDLRAVEKAVRGALLNETVQCPVLGELAGNRCLAYQRLPFSAVNPTRVELYRACRGCVHNETSGGR